MDRFRAVTALQRRVVNPLSRRLPPQSLIETTGRTSGRPRLTPVGGRVTDDTFWWVAEYGHRAQYVKNIEADPRVRIRVAGRWRTGTARVVADDDPIARLRTLPRLNSLMVRIVGTDLLTLCVRFD